MVYDYRYRLRNVSSLIIDASVSCRWHLSQKHAVSKGAENKRL